jgi:hypothetical protein
MKQGAASEEEYEHAQAARDLLAIELKEVQSRAMTHQSQEIQNSLKRVLAQLGMNMNSINKTVVYTEVTGILLLRATAADLSIAEAAIETLGGAKIDESRPVASESARRFKDAADAFAKVITPEARSEAARSDTQILIEQKEHQLKELSRKYKPQSPEIRRLREELDQLKREKIETK